ncbi:dyslexia-associated protein KIAA0319-like protein isoform X2 [Ostrea edulis]|uniref:dyslexia-associated protein KIAA0319-like protein isoform X2 n=1 Tax=Ostrea edulis TaxID=37623 RepID=UPI0024AEDB55|nr:dyslexia-associated protein KIAA0319-like protein isoform X2 [Ostrea edulis]XP_055996897.1 dyslexia-associated protein KIAA0319-like protein isoform X2 [Ostrea edulis]
MCTMISKSRDISCVKWMSATNGALLILLISISASLGADICKDSVKGSVLKTRIHQSSIPKGGTHAGQYTKDTTSSSHWLCIVACCQDPKSCDSAFFHKNICYLIKCNVTNIGGCDAVQKTDAKYNDTFYINVRDVEYQHCDLLNNNGCNEREECRYISGATVCVCKVGYVQDQLGTCVAVSSSSSSGTDIKECEYPLDNTCPEHEECYLPGHTHSRVGTCRCKDGYHRDSTKACVAMVTKVSDLSTTQSTTKANIENSVKVCEYGLNSCGKHQECYLPKNSLRRSGICVCVQGFYMGTDNHCVGNPSTTPIPSTTEKIISTTPKAGHRSKRGMINKTISILTVSAGKSKELQLPKDETALTCFVVEKEKKGEKFQYEWSLITHPDGSEKGTMVGKNTDKLTISKLIAGLYTFKIEVTGQNRKGEAFINVTVLPPTRQNSPPVAVIKPTKQTVKLPHSAILDGSDSSDDDKIVKYLWEEMSGPLQDHKIQDDKNMLTLKELVPGNYIFKLTVTDSDGATNSTVANVTVIKETDYPPKANAGSDKMIHLPQDSVILYGNSSTDDKGIKSYEWIKSADDKLAADMTGTTSPFLHLSKLQEGDYSFTLKVTDTADQVSTASVHLFVKPDVNTAPLAVTAGKLTRVLPLKGLVLDGRNSTDDKKIEVYSWTQTGGSPTLKIMNSNSALATVVGDITPGEYKFMLTVTDQEKLKSTQELTITVKELPNKAPISHAGGEIIVTLPVTLVEIDGSKSSDDKKIVRYSWARDAKSLAAGDILNNTDHEAVLQLVNLVAGKYIFTLTVSDAEGLSSSDTAKLLVKEDPHKDDLIELTLDTNLGEFTVEDRENLRSQLASMLPKSADSDINIEIQNLHMSPNSLLHVSFYVANVWKESHDYRPGMETAKLLKKQLEASNYHILNFKVLSLDTIVCQNNCSGHGYCDNKSKTCVCDAFWMQNFFIFHVMNGESNCDWSILYVIIVSFLLVVALAAIVWGTICWIKKRRCKCYRWKTRKRHRYSLLQEVDDAKDEIKLLPKGKPQSSSVMISDSDLTSEEETLFINHKKTNGFIQKPLNGVSKHVKTKLRA